MNEPAQAGGGQPLNVLYLNHSGQISGAEQSLQALLWQLRRCCDEISPTVALPSSGPLAEVLRSEGWNVTFAPLRRLHRPGSLMGGMAALLHVVRTAPFVAHLIRQTKSHLVHSNSTTAHLVGGTAAARAGRPAIWHARDLVSLQQAASALARRATAVVAISQCVADQLTADGVPREKIRLIYNGLDPDQWQPDQPAAVREALGLAPDTFLFGCAGQLVPWKNHRLFIEAAHQLAQDEGCAGARFVILGSDLWGDQPEYAASLRQLVKEYKLQDRFNFVPHQANNTAALASLDALVLCSHAEPFGRVLIEAMALRRVAIAFAAKGPLEIITHEHDGLLVPLDEADGLAAAMRRALTDAALREHLASQARETVVEKFHIADSAQHVQDLYREVLA